MCYYGFSDYNMCCCGLMFSTQNRMLGVGELQSEILKSVKLTSSLFFTDFEPHSPPLTPRMEEVQGEEDRVPCPVHSLIPSVKLYCISAQEKASNDVGNVVADSALW